jgi:hypothetical protein
VFGTGTWFSVDSASYLDFSVSAIWSAGLQYWPVYSIGRFTVLAAGFEYSPLIGILVQVGILVAGYTGAGWLRIARKSEIRIFMNSVSMSKKCSAALRLIEKSGKCLVVFLVAPI